MKKIFETVKFNMVLYFKSPRFVVPLLANSIFLFVMYYEHAGKYDIVSVLSITVFFIFYLMLWVGNSIISLKNEKLEQILMLRIGKYKVSISELIFVSVLSLLVMIICYGIPVLFNFIGSGFLIKQQLPNILYTLVIVWFSGIIGGVIGSFFHNNIIKDRKMVALISVLIAILSLSREAIIEQMQCAKYVLFFLPPLDEIRKCIDFSSGLILSGQSCLLIFEMMIYILIVCVVKHIICNKRLYD